jgi:Sel1 repeat
MHKHLKHGISVSDSPSRRCIVRDVNGEFCTKVPMLRIAVVALFAAGGVAVGGVAAGGAVSVARAQPVAAPSPDPARFDVMGVRIGMSPQQVLDALREHDPFMTRPLLVQASPGPALPGGETVRVIAAFRTDSAIAGTAARSAAPGGSEEVVALFTRHLPARVYAVAHSVSYDPSQLPQRTAFVSGLRAFYGEPAEQRGAANGELFRWVYDPTYRDPTYRHPDPAAPAGRALLDACAERGDRTAAQEVGKPQTPFSDALLVSEGGDPGCGLRLRLRLLTDGATVTRFFQDMVSDVLARADDEDAPLPVATAPLDQVDITPLPALPPTPHPTVVAHSALVQPALVQPALVQAAPLPAAPAQQAPSDIAGEIEADLQRAAMYDTGHGAAQNFATALEWYRRAAGRGSVAGMFNVAVMYDAGRGIAADATQAAFWYDQAARRGYARAQYNLALMLESDERIPRDPARAAALFRQAAANGIAAARQHLVMRTSAAIMSQR